jgi:hypothetical protein
VPHNSEYSHILALNNAIVQEQTVLALNGNVVQIAKKMQTNNSQPNVLKLAQIWQLTTKQQK